MEATLNVPTRGGGVQTVAAYYPALENASTALHHAHLLTEAVQAQVEALGAKLQGVAGTAGLVTALGILVQQLLDTVATAAEESAEATARAVSSGVPHG